MHNEQEYRIRNKTNKEYLSIIRNPCEQNIANKNQKDTGTMTEE